MIWVCLLLAGCVAVPSPPKGGSSDQSIPPAGLVPAATQSMRQPDAPEGRSKQELLDREVEHRADGVVVIRERHATTELGGTHARQPAGSEPASRGAHGGGVAHAFEIDALVGHAVACGLGSWRQCCYETTLPQLMAVLGARTRLDATADLRL
jgi:hypothetical protein